VSTPSRNLRAALEYAQRGWPCFPLKPLAKTPITRNGFKDATTDQTQIQKWWRTYPKAGVGIATGATSGLVVLDVDPARGGDSSLSELGDLPPTIHCKTGGGGAHYYFSHPGGQVRCAVNIRPGLDVRADGGYVAAPFTRHPSGKFYEFEPGESPQDVVAAPPPAALLEWLQRKPATLNEERIFPEGTRNDGLTSLAGTMLRRGMSADAILAAMLRENATKCVPPLLRTEVEAIVTGLVKRYTATYAASPGLPPESADIKKLELLNVASLVGRDPEPINWIMEGRLAQGDCALLVGPEGSGKTWITLEIAIAGATANPILGMFTPWKQLTTLLIDEENPPDEIHRRLRAITKAWGANPEELAKRIILPRPRQGFSFREPSYVRSLLQLVEARRPDLIVLDSVTAISDVKDENKPLEVRRFFHDRLYPLQSVCESTILVVHHANKLVWRRDNIVGGTGAVRGGDYAAAGDAVLFLWPILDRKPGDPRGFRFATEKCRRGATPPDLFVQIVDGFPAGARPIAEEMPEGGYDIPSTDEAETVMQSVEAAIITVLESRPDWKDAPMVLTWASVLVPSLKRRTFYRALEKMVGTGVVQRERDNAGTAIRVRLRPTES
jgi:putative DNA primase/helicase